MDNNEMLEEIRKVRKEINKLELQQEMAHLEKTRFGAFNFAVGVLCGAMLVLLWQLAVSI